MNLFIGCQPAHGLSDLLSGFNSVTYIVPLGTKMSRREMFSQLQVLPIGLNWGCSPAEWTAGCRCRWVLIGTHVLSTPYHCVCCINVVPLFLFIYRCFDTVLHVIFLDKQQPDAHEHHCEEWFHHVPSWDPCTEHVVGHFRPHLSVASSHWTFE